jgi:hypothetical protein
MKFPYLSQWDNADCIVTITDTKPSENGDFPTKSTYEGRCNLSEKSHTVRTINGEYVKLACVLHIKGDIAPDLATFSGKATVNGKEMLIETVDRPRNPDGTVHHTRLGLV